MSSSTLDRPRLSRRIWLRSGAVALAAAGAVTVVTSPSHAVLQPAPSSIMVRDYYSGNESNIVGQHYITACPGGPLSTDWGTLSGPSFFTTLPCTPAGDPSPTKPFPVDPNPTLPGTGF